MKTSRKSEFPLELILTADGFTPEPLFEQSLEDNTLLAQFKADRWDALYRLGLGERPEGLPPSAQYLCTVAEAFFRALTSQPELELLREKAQAPLSDEESAKLLQSVPFVIGAEYVDRAWLERLFDRLNQIYAREIAAYAGTVAFYLAEQSQRLRVPERVFFHLVESKDEEFPFAFLATYATRGENGQISHVPLQYALTEYGGTREKLLELLACLNRAAEISPLIGSFMESGELFHPLKLTAEEASGKLGVLRELCETIRDKRERVLVFTQFRELTEPLADFLTGIFRARGYVLHGGTHVSKRSEIVEAFQGEEYVPFIVLSLKAGGTGLNLTKASHVIHFDRWWNLAVENQATDRAYRIGQTQNVMVHKLVCDGTIEEKIDEMIEAKRELAENVIQSGAEKWLTELSNTELLSILRLEGGKAV